MANLETLGYFFSLSSAFSWALASILYKGVGNRFSPTTITTVKAFISAVFFGILLLIRGCASVNGSPLHLLVISGILGISLGDTLFFFSLNKLSALLALLITILIPVMTVIMAALFLAERLSGRVLFGMALTIAGIAFVSVKEVRASKTSRTTFIGIISGIISALSCSASVVLAKRALTSVSVLEATFIRQVSGLTVMLVFAAASVKRKTWLNQFAEDLRPTTQLLSAAFIGAFLGTWFCLIGLKLAPAAITSVLNSTSPLFMIALSSVFLREKISTNAILGSVIAVSGIVLIIMGNANAR